MRDCHALLVQCRRIRGQIEALESMMERCDSCEEIVSLALAVDKSFDTLKRRMLRKALHDEFALRVPADREAALETVFKLANS